VYVRAFVLCSHNMMSTKKCEFSHVELLSCYAKSLFLTFNASRRYENPHEIYDSGNN
jgi:hypothetical protein